MITFIANFYYYDDEWLHIVCLRRLSHSFEQKITYTNNNNFIWFVWEHYVINVCPGDRVLWLLHDEYACVCIEWAEQIVNSCGASKLRFATFYTPSLMCIFSLLSVFPVYFTYISSQITFLWCILPTLSFKCVSLVYFTYIPSNNAFWVFLTRTIWSSGAVSYRTPSTKSWVLTISPRQNTQLTIYTH